MDVRDYARILRKNWLVVVSTVLLGVCIAAGASLLTKPSYEATTQLYVSVRGENAQIGELAQGSTLARQSVATYAGIVSSESVLRPVIDRLGLDLSVPQLAGRVSAEAPLNQSLINIAVTGDDAEQTAKVANAVGESLTRIVEDELEAGSGDDDTSLVKLTTVQPAVVPGAPVSPRTTLNLILGALAGLVLGIGIALLRAVLDTRVRSAHDIEQAADVPLLGGIVFDPEAKKRPLIVHASPRSPRAESFRTLRTNLQFLAVSDARNERGRCFVISSAAPGEGKTTTSVNLALALAETGSRVALVEADLRLPKVAQYMGVEGAAGLTDVLIGRAEIADVLQRWGRGQLYLLTSGKLPPNPSELLGSRAMVELLDTLAEHFDYIIVDAPPLLSVTDAAVVSKASSGTLLVAAAGATRKHELAAAARSLATAGGQLLGVIATMLPSKGPDSYGYGAYGAYGGYGDSSAQGRGSSRDRA